MTDLYEAFEQWTLKGRQEGERNPFTGQRSQFEVDSIELGFEAAYIFRQEEVHRAQG